MSRLRVSCSAVQPMPSLTTKRALITPVLSAQPKKAHPVLLTRGSREIFYNKGEGTSKPTFGIFPQGTDDALQGSWINLLSCALGSRVESPQPATYTERPFLTRTRNFLLPSRAESTTYLAYVDPHL
jgi:hypothetical protein